jgi:predicted CXXCH cytochrome family protein
MRMAVVLALALAGCGGESPPPARTASPAPALAPLSYVGGAECVDCHAGQAEAWRGSDHDRAMQVADESTVFGDFHDARFRKDGVETSFFRREGSFFVRTDGADGKLAEFRIAYTFGVDPLQQYLVEFPDGRLQALSIVWDTRPVAAGGQRWYHLYPDEKVPAGDVLHWTAPSQNWNHMCAECHSTALAKGYDAASDRFRTTWKDIDVNCEACHGPGSRHVAWAAAPPAQRAGGSSDGLAFRLQGSGPAAWRFAPNTAIAHRAKRLQDQSEIETCARCHSRRGQAWAEYRHGDPLAQTHRVALLDDGLYHADGQIRDEVYEYGSFLQSAMHAAGVTCSDCHDPHSSRLRADGDAVCAQCHLPGTYAAAAHTRHRDTATSPGCIACHMLERTYMGVDARRDHGFRVPRPDLSVELGTPNACSECHRDRDAGWAARAVAQWTGMRGSSMPAFAHALAAGRRAAPEAPALLREVAGNDAQPAIVRATAVELLANASAAEDVALFAAAGRDPDPLVRRATAGALDNLPAQAWVAIGSRLLDDAVRTVRLEAAGSMVEVPPEALDGAARRALERALDEYRQSQRVNADRAEGPLNLGTLALRQGDAAGAERELRVAVSRQPQFVPARINLADALRALGREPEAEAELHAALALDPGNADAHFALGLALTRQGRRAEAVAALDAAATARPQEPRYAYVLAVALHDTGAAARAIAVLEQSAARHPRDRGTLVALVQFLAEGGDAVGAKRWATRLLELAPDDPEIRALAASVGAG